MSGAAQLAVGARGPRAPDAIDEAMAVTSSAGWLMLGAVAALVVAGVVWAGVTDVPIRVSTRGMLVSAAGLADVSMAVRGRILVMDVAPGDIVAPGDLIAEIGQPDLEAQIAIKEVQLRETRARQEALVDFQQRATNAQSTSANARIEAARLRLGLLGERERALRERDGVLLDLLRKGLSNREAALRSQAELAGVMDQIAAARAEIVAAGNELHLLQIQSEKDTLAVAEEISRLSAELEETRRLMTHSRELRSPYAGRVIEVKHGAGDFAEAGAEIIALERPSAGDLLGVAFVPPENGKEVRVGMLVQVAPAGVKSNEFGFMLARVTAVSDAPATEAGIQRSLRNATLVRQLTQQGAPFRIELRLEAADTPSGYRWTSSNGPAQRIDSGTPIEAHVITRQARMLGLLVPPLARFFAR